MNNPVAYPLLNQVTVDGKYTSPREWNDTIVFEAVAGLGETVYFSAKYDSTYLYTIWDFPECKTSFTGSDTKGANQVLLYLNPLNKRSATVDNTMYRIAAWEYGAPVARVSGSQGLTGGGWAEWAHIDGHFLAALQYTSSPHSQTPHFVLELRIALTFANLKSATTNSSIGIALGWVDNFGNGFEVDYPSDYNYKDPSTWGTMSFSHMAVPEFPLSPTVPFLVTIFVTILACKIARKKLEGR
ncbi:MAG: hypothetical protein ABSF09_14005 [Candidatus Bathyarchaeia archaeon]